MRKLIVLCHLSLDGIAAVPSGSLDWISYDADLENWAAEIVANTDTAVYGHVTYELMKYWKTVPSDPDASEHELHHAQWIEEVEKIVFSKTLKTPDWNNTTIVNDNAKQEILKLKQKTGKDITIFGSPTLANSLIKFGLVDEYHLSVNPVVLGKGKFLFNGLNEELKFKLIEEKTLTTGAVTLHYVAQN